MRRDLLKQLPALTHFYGLRPWEVEELTYAEVDEYLGQLAEYQRKTEEAARKVRR